MSNNVKDYSDIIDLPHHVSSKHPQMARMNRAAQFAPFAALTGYDDMIEDAGLRNAEKEDTVIFTKEYIDNP